MTRTRTARATSHVARSTWQAARSTWHIARSTFLAILLVALGASAARAQDPRTDGWVVLSLDEYRALRARAFPVPPAPNPPPVDAALTRVDYDLRANGDTVSGEARLTVDVLKQGWVSIQAPAGVLVRSARLNGRPTALVAGTPPRVLISSAGRATLTLDIVVPIATSGGTESMTLPASPSALSSVRLTIPRTSVELASSGGIVTEQIETARETRWSVYGSPGRPVSFSWKRKSDDRRSTMPLRMDARVTSLIVLGEESSLITTGVRADVKQGSTREIALTIPAGVTVNQVSGATVADWNQQANTLTVSFLEPLTTTASIVITSETRMPREGAVAIPLIRMPVAEQESGGVAVDVAGTGEIGERRPVGLDASDPAILGDVVSGRDTPSMAAFRFKTGGGSAQRALSVDVSRYLPAEVLVANIEEARYEALIGEDGKTLVRARYAVRNNQRSFLAVTLPPDATLWSAALAGRTVRPGVSPNGSLLLPLQKARAGEAPPTVAVEIVYLQLTSEWTERGTSALSLPAVDLPVSRTGLTVRHSPRFAVELKPGAFRPDADPGPWTIALQSDELTIGVAGAAGRGIVAGLPESPPPPPASPAEPARAEIASNMKMGGLSVDSSPLASPFRSDSGRAIAGILPVGVRVPEFGAMLFAAAELTAEGRAPTIEFAYKRTARR